MAIQIYPDYDTLSLHAAGEIAAQLVNRPDSTICLAAGDTPRLAYQLFVKMVREEDIDCSRCTFVGLDEWIGIPSTNEGSCHYLLNAMLFEPLNIRASQIRLFDGMTTDSEAECKRMDDFIREREGLDLMMAGVGMNGHIGFNEPGVREDLRSHVIDLDGTTRSVGKKYFREAIALDKGITLGLKYLLESRRAIVIASGRKKANIIKLALQGEIGSSVPASIIRKHVNGVTMLDEDAASRLTII